MIRRSAHERAGRRFADAIASPEERPLSAVGVEHEFRVTEDDRRIDFRSVIHGLDLGTPNLDPVDPFAYTLGSGAKVTCDEQEAEVATAPEPTRPGFTMRLEGSARATRNEIRLRIPGAWRLEGCSTHINVGAGRFDPASLAWRYLQTFAPGLMLLMDGPDAPGLLVRPRPGRVELGGSFVNGPWLRAAGAFAVGSVRALAAGRPTGVPDLSLVVEPNFMRFGWYVDRRAFGPDLYEEGRRARLPLADGGEIGAQALLEDAWASARRELTNDAAPKELELVDALVDGRLPLRIEAGSIDVSRDAAPPAHSFGSILAPRQRRGFDAAPVMVTWELVVLLLISRWRRRRAFACVPRRSVERFVRMLDAGELDDTISSYLRAPSSGSVLDAHDLATGPGLFDRIGPRAHLLAPERLPLWDGLGRAPRIPLPGAAAVRR
jgi:hypothetical protein